MQTGDYFKKVMTEKDLEVTSKKFWLNSKDFLRGLIIAMITAALMVIQNSFDAGELVFNWKQIIMAAIGGGVAYLLKNFFQPAQVKQTINSNQVDAIKDITNTKEAAK